MKRKIAKLGMVLILIVMLVVLTGCGKERTNTNTSAGTTNSDNENNEIYDFSFNTIYKLRLTQIKNITLKTAFCR